MSDEMKIKRCMFCGKKRGRVAASRAVFYVVCGDRDACCAEGPIAPTEAEAIAKWNAAPRRKRKQVGDNLPDHSGLNCRCVVEPVMSETLEAPVMESQMQFLRDSLDEHLRYHQVSSIPPRLASLEQNAADHEQAIGKLGEAGKLFLESQDILRGHEESHYRRLNKHAFRLDEMAARLDAVEKRLAEVDAKVSTEALERRLFEWEASSATDQSNVDSIPAAPDDDGAEPD